MTDAPHPGLIRIEHNGTQHIPIVTDENLAEVDQIVREVLPEAVSIVLSDTEKIHDQDAFRISYILGRHGVLLYRAGDRDPYVALLETHLSDALARSINPQDPHPQQSNSPRCTHTPPPVSPRTCPCRRQE